MEKSIVNNNEINTEQPMANNLEQHTYDENYLSININGGNY